MPEAYSLSREFDFVRLDGLRRSTGRPAHEWDIYIIKELVDNALDADETVWRQQPDQSPDISVQIEYISVPEPASQQLFVQVQNQTLFPINKIEEIFATQRYTSRKAFFKGLTRGALGNALKTLLGIPYALRNNAAGDWSPGLKPMSILCDGVEYLPRYMIDSTSQSIQFECSSKTGKNTSGTIINVGLDTFVQELPRKLADIEHLAHQYHLCNPHAHFHWTVEMNGDEWRQEFEANANWVDKFRGTAPVQWYSLSAFQNLLGAMYREETNESREHLTLERIHSRFAQSSVELSEHTLQTVAETFGSETLTIRDIESSEVNKLYRVLLHHSPRFTSTELGKVGQQHINDVLGQVLSLDSEVFYDAVTDSGDNPDVPFVIEAAVARLTDGTRQMWTAMNFTPTYGDPVRSRLLRGPVQPEEQVLGLRGLLDAYGIGEDTPIVLFLHIICPNIEHNEFSKTEINHLPFKNALGTVLGKVLQSFRQATEEAELRLEQTVFQTLEEILNELGQHERFVFDQLLERLRVKLREEKNLGEWLETPDATSRLRAYITTYQSRNTTLLQRVARSMSGSISLPLHPDRHLTVLAEHFTQHLTVYHHINKVLYVQGRELEPVVIENNWLCRMDMALLHNPSTPDELRIVFQQCVNNTQLPIVVLHNGDDPGTRLIKQIHAWLDELHLDTHRIVDIGLTTNAHSGDTNVRRLTEMMPNELELWLLKHLGVFGISAKSLPSDSDIRRDIVQKFEHMLRSHVWEGMSHHLGFVQLLDSFDQQFRLSEAMQSQRLDERLKATLCNEACTRSYAAVLDEIVETFFASWMRQRNNDVQDLIEEHLKHLPDKGRA
jgi:hypothetical protein